MLQSFMLSGSLLASVMHVFRITGQDVEYKKWDMGLTEQVNLNYRTTLYQSFSILHLLCTGSYPLRSCPQLCVWLHSNFNFFYFCLADLK